MNNKLLTRRGIAYFFRGALFGFLCATAQADVFEAYGESVIQLVDSSPSNAEKESFRDEWISIFEKELGRADDELYKARLLDKLLGMYSSNGDIQQSINAAEARLKLPISKDYQVGLLLHCGTLASGFGNYSAKEGFEAYRASRDWFVQAMTLAYELEDLSDYLNALSELVGLLGEFPEAGDGLDVPAALTRAYALYDSADSELISKVDQLNFSPKAISGRYVRLGSSPDASVIAVKLDFIKTLHDAGRIEAARSVASVLVGEIVESEVSIPSDFVGRLLPFVEAGGLSNYDASIQKARILMAAREYTKALGILRMQKEQLMGISEDFGAIGGRRDALSQLFDLLYLLDELYTELGLLDQQIENGLEIEHVKMKIKNENNKK